MYPLVLAGPVILQFGESVYISVGRSDVDTEEALSKRLFAFNSLVGLLYGPVDSWSVGWEKVKACTFAYAISSVYIQTYIHVNVLCQVLCIIYFSDTVSVIFILRIAF